MDILTRHNDISEAHFPGNSSGMADKVWVLFLDLSSQNTNTTDVNNCIFVPMSEKKSL